MPKHGKIKDLEEKERAEKGDVFRRTKQKLPGAEGSAWESGGHALEWKMELSSDVTVLVRSNDFSK